MPASRRTLIVALGGVPVFLSGGCLGDTPRDPEDFEQCQTITVGIEQLPEPARNEVETALEDESAQYETNDELYLPHVIDIETTYVERRSGEFFRATTESIGETNRLTLSPTTPSLGMRSLDLLNSTGEAHTVELRVLRLPSSSRREDHDELVVETTVEIDDEETVTVGAFDRKFGDYLAEATIDGTTHRTRWKEEAAKGPLAGLGISRQDGTIELLPDAQPHTHGDGFDCDWESG
ncbi:MAG: hypothetical protein PPP58_04000 [Natronomonas sp.]